MLTRHIGDSGRSDLVADQIRPWTFGPAVRRQHKQTAAEVEHLRSLVYTDPTHACKALTPHTTRRCVCVGIDAIAGADKMINIITVAAAAVCVS